MEEVNDKPVIRRTRSLADITDSGEDFQKIVIGVCAMDKKARSNPMKEIIRRLTRYGEFTIRIFGDEVILNKPVEEWPECDCLFSWHSDKFPLHKAEKYVELRKPFLINDVNKQKHLKDRRKVYSMLKEAGIPVPVHIVVNRDDLPDGQSDPDGFIETEEYVEMNGRRIEKPFVEKPASGENHNIFIYYPKQMGGGIKCLFRKLNNRSAEYLPNHSGRVRRDGSFIYEEFLATGGTDVKVYTVGPRYAHAEARKSPVVDGVVQRSPDGKEVRFPILLDQQEKEIARIVTLAFGQKVCGFDLLRSDRGTFVCDVNGWSFVKSSYKYYEDAARILRMGILNRLAPYRVSIPSRNYLNLPQPSSPEWQVARDPASFSDLDAIGDEGGREWEELRCVLLVARHGDRTPKQKMKIKVSDSLFLGLFEKYKDKKGKQAKLKNPAELQELLDAAREILERPIETQKREVHGLSLNLPEAQQQSTENKAVADEFREKIRTLVTVLEAGGHFSGINRKVQFKPTRWSTCSVNSTESAKVEEVLLILKYGGILTHAGREQAEKFGRHFRTTMYPGESGSSQEPSGGLLRLHSTYRHDLKIYSSDEGRVQTSAAAFAKGLLDLEGTSLTPILVSLVQKDTGMLDSCEEAASETIQRIKMDLYSQMTWNEDKKYSMKPPISEVSVPSPPPSPPKHSIISSGEASFQFQPFHCAPSESSFSVYSETSEVNEPQPSRKNLGIPEDCLKMLYQLKDLMEILVSKLYELCTNEKLRVVTGENSNRSYSSLSQDPADWEPPFSSLPCSDERLILMLDRWKKLQKSFHNRRDQFDVSKIPDIYDSAKYDAIHNLHLNLPLEDLFEVARNLANVVVPGEYGTDPESKGQIGVCICSQLLGKLLVDLANTKEECIVTAQLLEQSSEKSTPGYMPTNMDFGDCGFFDDFYLSPFIPDDCNVRRNVSGMHDSNEEASSSGSPKESGHRLCPTYAMNINSPMRHVRTRIYFTSESHIHALMNVLKYCREKDSLIKPMEIEQSILNIPEFDYLSHLVFRLYENPRVSYEDENRFRVEILFSPGAAYNPFERMSEKSSNHVLSIQPRRKLHKEDAICLNRLETLLKPWSTPRKVSQPFAWLTSQQWKERASKSTNLDSI